MSYEYPIQRQVREEGTVELEGMTLRIIPGKEYGSDLEPGDTYVAERNSGPKLLTVKEVHTHNTHPGARHTNWVVPVEQYAYSFDPGECAGVEIVEASSSSATVSDG